jgi:hypothetical protein
LDDSAADVAPGIANMEVDGQVPMQSSGTAVAPVTQVALTPFNHSPRTDRGREIVARAKEVSPHLVATPPPVSRAPSPSRGRIFMQGRTRPVPPVRSASVGPTPSSTSAQTEGVQPRMLGTSAGDTVSSGQLRAGSPPAGQQQLVGGLGGGSSRLVPRRGSNSHPHAQRSCSSPPGPTVQRLPHGELTRFVS